MTTPSQKRIIMQDRLSAFADGKDVNISGEKIVYGKTIGTDFKGSIGQKIKLLKDEYGYTFEMIVELLSKEFGKELKLSTIYNWAKGVQPREAAKEIEAALDNAIKTGDRIAGGAWCSAEETRERMSELNKKYTASELSEMSGVPITTIFAWISGTHRVPRVRFNHFESTIKAREAQ